MAIVATLLVISEHNEGGTAFADSDYVGCLKMEDSMKRVSIGKRPSWGIFKERMGVENQSRPATRVTRDRDRGRTAGLIAALSDADAVERQKARAALVEIGADAVPSLIQLLSDPRIHSRWEAAKTLGQIRDPQAAPVLVAALEDQDFDVRWLAAEGLIALRCAGLRPLLRALIQHPDSEWLREGAHWVCHGVAHVPSCAAAAKLVLHSLIPAATDSAAALAAWEALQLLA